LTPWGPPVGRALCGSAGRPRRTRKREFPELEGTPRAPRVCKRSASGTRTAKNVPEVDSGAHSPSCGPNSGPQPDFSGRGAQKGPKRARFRRYFEHRGPWAGRNGLKSGGKLLLAHTDAPQKELSESGSPARRKNFIGGFALLACFALLALLCLKIVTMSGGL
jgi:hypothetical protein